MEADEARFRNCADVIPALGIRIQSLMLNGNTGKRKITIKLSIGTCNQGQEMDPNYTLSTYVPIERGPLPSGIRGA